MTFKIIHQLTCFVGHTKRIEKIQIQIFNFFSGTLNNNITKTLTFCVQNYLLMRFWQINMSEL